MLMGFWSVLGFRISKVSDAILPLFGSLGQCGRPPLMALPACSST